MKGKGKFCAGSAGLVRTKSVSKPVFRPQLIRDLVRILATPQKLSHRWGNLLEIPMTLRRAAWTLDISPKTIRRACRRGLLKVYRRRRSGALVVELRDLFSAAILTLGKAAALFGRHYETFRRGVRSGRLKAYRFVYRGRNGERRGYRRVTVMDALKFEASLRPRKGGK